MAKYTELAKEIKSYDFDNFGIVMSKGEIAHMIWTNHMTPLERLEIMNQCEDSKSALLKLKACLKVIENQI